MHQPTIEKLHDLRLGAMADALTAQLQQPEIDAMPFAERLALLVDIQHSAMLTAALAQRLTRAGMRQSACMENLDLRTPRGLDRTTMQALASGLWIRQHRNVLISGAAGVGSGAAMRGTAALPGSETSSRTKGTRRNLGDLISPETALAITGRDGKPRRRSRRGRGEESDGCILPVKPRTKPTTNRWRRWWREGGRPEGRRAATHAPDTVPDTACNRSCEPAD